MTEHADDIAKLRAGMDQALAGMLELAATYASYWKKLVAEGLPPEAATAMTVGMQHDMLMNSRKEDP